MINRLCYQFFWFVILYFYLHILVLPQSSLASCEEPFQKTSVKQFKGYPPPSGGAVINRLFQSVHEGKIASFRDFYVIGTEGFQIKQSRPLFIENGSSFRVLNPYYYHRLIEILYPIFQSNKKGVIITTDIQEANRITEFLNKFVQEIKFEAYHSEISDKKKEAILNNSQNMDSHYMITTRLPDKKVDLSELSSYIDLNFSIGLRDRINRVSRALNLFNSEISCDVLLLVDYSREKNIKTLLELLETTDALNLDKSAEFFTEQDESLLFKNTDLVPLRRVDLHELRTKLMELVSNLREFREKRSKEQLGQQKKEWLPYKKATALVQREKIGTRDEFHRRREYDSKLQQIPYYPNREYKGKGWINWSAFLGTGRFSVKTGLPYGEAEELVQRKGIRTFGELKKRRKTEPELQQVPVKPEVTYKDSGWIDKYHFFYSLYDILKEHEDNKQISLPYFMESNFDGKSNIKNGFH